jgi:hypothetical protein
MSGSLGEDRQFGRPQLRTGPEIEGQWIERSKANGRSKRFEKPPRGTPSRDALSKWNRYGKSSRPPQVPLAGFVGKREQDEWETNRDRFVKSYQTVCPIARSSGYSKTLVDQGAHIGELHYLDELGKTKAYTFCYIATVNKIKGAAAGFALRPIALR